MNAKKIIIIVLVVILILVGGYFLFFNKKQDNSDNQQNIANTTTTTESEETEDEDTQDIAMVDVNYFASELYDALVLVDESIANESTSLDDDIATLSELVAQIDEYDTFVQDLSDSEYSSLKEAWQAFSDEAKSLYNVVDNETYSQGTNLITTDTIHTCFSNLGEAFEGILDSDSADSESTDNETSDDNTSDYETEALIEESPEESDAVIIEATE